MSLLLSDGLGYLRENYNPNAKLRWTDGNRRYHGRAPGEWANPVHVPSGIAALHTTEGLHDTAPPDLGAESTARYLATTSRSASYHSIWDSDSIVELLPPNFRAWHIAGGSWHPAARNGWPNGHIYGTSLGGHANRVYTDKGWMAAALQNGIRILHAWREWSHTHRGIYVPLQTITVDEAWQGARGFMEHGQWQYDRYDPGFSRRQSREVNYRPAGQLWDDLLAGLQLLESPQPPFPIPPSKESDIMIVFASYANPKKDQFPSQYVFKPHASWPHSYYISNKPGEDTSRVFNAWASDCFKVLAGLKKGEGEVVTADQLPFIARGAHRVTN